MDPTTISHLTSQLQTQASSLSSSNERQRQQLLATANALVRAIETPSERIARMCYADIYLFVAVRVLIDLDVFRLIAKADGGSVTVKKLAQQTGADEVLLGRLLKHVCTQGFVREVGGDEYAASGVTKKIA
jgi:hypothetical protein